MKEELVDYDTKSLLFKEREAVRSKCSLNPTEQRFYDRALELVLTYFPVKGRDARGDGGMAEAGCFVAEMRTGGDSAPSFRQDGPSRIRGIEGCWRRLGHYVTRMPSGLRSCVTEVGEAVGGASQ